MTFTSHFNLKIYCLALLFIYNSASFANTPLAQAFSGGASALEEVSVFGVDRNPASIFSKGSGQLELGAHTQSDSISPVFAFVMPFSRSGYWGGVWQQSPDAEISYQAQLSLKLKPFKSLSFGLSPHIRSSKDSLGGSDLGTDLSAGVYFSPSTHFSVAGNFIRLSENLPSADYGDERVSFQSMRTTQVGLAWLYQPFSIVYDWELRRLRWGEMTHIAGVKWSPGEEDYFHFVSSVMIPQSQWNSPQLAAGVRVELPTPPHRFSVSYSISEIAFSSKGSPFKHALSLGLVLNADYDREPPRARIRVNNPVFSPDGLNDLPKSTIFSLQGLDASDKYLEWHVLVNRVDGDMQNTVNVRRFSGQGMPPKMIRWLGDDHSGSLLQAGMYAYRFIVKDANHNGQSTNWQLLEIR